MGEVKMFDTLDQGQLTQQLLDAVIRDADDLRHRAEAARDMLASGKTTSAGFYATMIRASYQACGDSLRRIGEISDRDARK